MSAIDGNQVHEHVTPPVSVGHPPIETNVIIINRLRGNSVSPTNSAVSSNLLVIETDPGPGDINVIGPESAAPTKYVLNILIYKSDIH